LLLLLLCEVRKDVYEVSTTPDTGRPWQGNYQYVNPLLPAPMMADLLKSWARENRLKFQPFVCWLATEFVAAYQDRKLQPQ
jgi:hypothetical protein